MGPGCENDLVWPNKIFIAHDLDQRQERVEGQQMEKGKSHFVLVHGACHGAWCWYKVVTMLKSAGHKVTALDLAASGVHPKQVLELHSISDYSEPLMEFMASLPPKERVILVGHSMGGVTISVAMERFPEKVSVAVFAPASMPGPDLSYISLRQEVLSLSLSLSLSSQTWARMLLLPFII